MEFLGFDVTGKLHFEEILQFVKVWNTIYIYFIEFSWHCFNLLMKLGACQWRIQNSAIYYNPYKCPILDVWQGFEYASAYSFNIQNEKNFLLLSLHLRRWYLYKRYSVSALMYNVAVCDFITLEHYRSILDII